MHERRSRRPDAVWLFPPTYIIHLVEEYFAGGGFTMWAERALALRFSSSEFIAWNAFALGLMCIGASLVSRDPRYRFIEIALGIAVLGNVFGHVLGSLATWTYSPGLITAVVLWIPLGAVRLRSATRASTRKARIAGAYLGLSVVLIVVAVMAFGVFLNRR